MNNNQNHLYQTDLETAILHHYHQALGDEIHIVESDEEATMMQLHNRSGDDLQTISAGLRRQIDPSYQ